jgi:hypothetical protein
MDVAAVLMPGERGRPIGAFDDVLLIEQIRRVTDRGPTDVRHKFTEEEPPKLSLLPRDLVREVPAAPNVDVQRVGAEGVHLGIGLGDRVLRTAAKQLHVGLRQHARQQKVSLLAKLVPLLIRND